MISPDKVTVVIVTRGDCDLTPVLDPIKDAGLGFFVWNNLIERDEGIFGRYAAIGRLDRPVIATQDDDVVVTCWDKLLDAYEPGVLTVNYPEPWDIPWVARGSIFDRDLPKKAFTRYLAAYPYDRLFTHRICDAVFALLTENVNVIDEGSEDLPHGFHAGRVSTSGDWYTGDRLEAQRRCRELLQAAA